MLKLKHTLVGKGLLPMVLGILIAESNVAATDLARIEKIDHPLTWA
jgi:hypothetical protein